jgi:hypothetical protein
MREIQDLTLNAARGLDAVAVRLEQLAAEFQRHLSEARLKSNTHATVAVRATAVPLQPLVLQRDQLARVRERTCREFSLTHSGGQTTRGMIPMYGWNPRPVLRGVTLYNRATTAYCEHALYTDGSQNLMFINQELNGSEAANVMYMDWLLGVSASLLHSVTGMSEIVETPAAEFAIEIQISGSNRGADVLFWNHGRASLPDLAFVLPQYSFIPEEGSVALMAQIYGDVLNTLGRERTLPIVAVEAR